MRKPKERLFIYATDAMQLTGRSYSTSLRLLRDIRRSFRKERNESLTIAEFCEYMNIEETAVREILFGSVSGVLRKTRL